MQTNKTLIFDKNADNIFKKGDYVNSYMVIDLKSVNLDFQIEEQNVTNYNLIATLTDTNNNPIPNNIIEFYKTINDDNCVIDFESDKEFVRNNQICILTATVTQNNNPLENILVQFYNDDVLIGESITNENGQALFEYVGYGTDDVIITAKSDNIISNSVNLGNYSDVTKNIELDDTNNIVQIDDTLVLTAHILDEYQQPYENLSVSFIQKNKQLFTNSCKSGVTDIDQWVAQSGSSVTRESDGSVFATTGSATGFIWANKTGTSTSSSLGDYYGDCVVEMDILSTDDQYNGIMFYETYQTNAKVTIFYPPTNHSTGHYKIVKTGDNFKVYIDDIQVNNRDFELEEPYRIGVRVANGGHNIKIANFSIIGDEPVYPVGETKIDNGTISSHNDIWTVFDGTLTRYNNYSELTIGTNKTMGFMNFDLTPTPFVMEFDIKSGQNNGWLATIRKGGTIVIGLALSQFNLAVDEWHHIKILYDGTQITFSNGENATIKQTTTNDFNRFQIDARNSSYAQFKNFRMYKILDNPVTDSNGIASINILGDGSGVEIYSAKCDNIESEPVEVVDAIVIEENEISAGKVFNKTLDNQDLYIEFTVHPSASTDAVARLLIRQDSTQYLNLGDLYANANCGLQWTYGGVTSSFYGKGISTDVDTKVTFTRRGTNVILTVGESIYNITDMPLSLNTLERAVISSNSIKDLKVYPLESKEPVGLLTVTSNKNILSAYDSETATLTATYTKYGVGVSGKTVTFKKGSTILDTKTTDSNGIATYDYNANGSGDITITVECESLSETQAIEDLLYFNDGTKTSGITAPSGVTLTTEDGMLKIHGTTSGEKRVYYPKSFTSSDNFIVEFEVAKIGVEQSIALYLKDSTTANGCWFAYNDNERKWSGGISTTWNVTDASISVGDKVKIKQENGVLTLYHNDTVLYTKSRSFSGTYYVGHYTNTNRIQYVKNIKVKPL